MSVLQSKLFAGIEHGFGTRHSGLTQDAMVSLKQIHSGLVLSADRDTGCVGEGDALIADHPGRTISIRTADCLPIILADRRTAAVAAIHAGWRGTAAQIAPGAVERMTEKFGSQPGDIIAAIGPGIGQCCYEVGDEVARQFGESGLCHLNLAEHNRSQLEKIGVRPGNIDVIATCTFCNADEFFSYRREGERAGRMISYIQTPRAR